MPDGAAQRNRLQYLDEYLGKIGIKTIVAEHDYIDRNFIDDYCGYYARCYRDLPKKCERLLFFNCGISDRAFETGVLNPESEERSVIERSYCGYIVLRPVAGAPLGKVCLATYPEEEGKLRQFPLLQTYRSHFLGLNLEVRSIAYQEQDNIIGACATSSLWSAFHCLSHNSGRNVPSPFTITQNAHKILIEPEEYNVLDKGLFPSQMALAISDEGYAPLMNVYSSKSYLKAVCRAYMNVGQPIILGVTLAYENEEKHSGSGMSHIIGRHAITIVGYRIKEGLPAKYISNHFKPTGGTESGEAARNAIHLLASNIDKFYVHDDQIGPFASLIDRSESWPRFETRWNYYKDPKDKVDADAGVVIIPSDKKIRIKFGQILNFVGRCNRQLGVVFSKLGKQPVWDPRLFSVSDFKTRIADREYFENDSDELRLKVLSMKLPRFIWVADLWQYAEGKQEKLLISYILDATDMESADYLLGVVHHDEFSYEISQRIFASLQTEKTGLFAQMPYNRMVFRNLAQAYTEADITKLLR